MTARRQTWLVSLIVVLVLWNGLAGDTAHEVPAAELAERERAPARVLLKVRPGDSLADLTYRVNRRYRTRLSLVHLQRSNRIRHARLIHPGARIVVPVVSRGDARRDAIVRGEAAIFQLREHPARSSRPFHELPELSAVERFDPLIRRAARRHRVDVNLVRAIVYMETTHGWYDAVTGLIVPPRSLRPMNVNVGFWGHAFGVTRADLEDPRRNIEIGVRILRGIQARTMRPDVRRVATLYNNLSADRVNDYGARVETIYTEKLWRSR